MPIHGPLCARLDGMEFVRPLRWENAMLRRKLLLILALLTVLMLGTALSSVLMMQTVLRDMEHINAAALLGTSASRTIGEQLDQIESELDRWSADTHLADPPTSAASLWALTNALGQELDALKNSYHIDLGIQGPVPGLAHALSDLEKKITQATRSDPANAARLVRESRSLIRQMRLQVHDLAAFGFEYMKAEQHDLTRRFRWTAISLAIIFVVLMNVSIFVLFRAAALVIRPVDQLLDASRHLAREDYGYRVDIGKNDEFHELAQGFNHLAEQLELNEERKIETLRQVARTLSHELNNAIAIIELQLRMVSKSPGYDDTSSQQLQRIHDALRHMNQTVMSLTHVRRVVLMDYIEGVKMLDIKLSTQPDAPPDPDASDEVCTP